MNVAQTFGVVTILYCAGFALGKGTTTSRYSGGSGWYGAGYGGGYRYYYVGGYAPYNRYYIYPTMWRSGPRTRTYSDPAFEATLEDVMCKRNITTSYDGDTINMSSVKQCVHQNSNQPLSSTNTPVDGLVFDLFKYSVSWRAGEPVRMSVTIYSDSLNIGLPLLNFSVELIRIEFASPQGQRVVDFANATWEAFQGPTVSGFIDSNLYTSQIRFGDIALRFQLSDDFVEDGSGHLFYRPDALVVTLSTVPCNTASGCPGKLYANILTDKAKQSYYERSPIGTNYDPPSQDRITLGTMAEENRGFVSWRRTVHSEDQCLESQQTAKCILTGCEASSPTAECGSTQSTSSRFPLTLSWSSTNGKAPVARLNVGYMDPGTVSSSSASRSPFLIPIVICVLLLLY